MLGLFFDMLSMGVCRIRYRQMTGRQLVQELLYGACSRQGCKDMSSKYPTFTRNVSMHTLVICTISMGI